jgi:hypothetical protein
MVDILFISSYTGITCRMPLAGPEPDTRIQRDYKIDCKVSTLKQSISDHSISALITPGFLAANCFVKAILVSDNGALQM